MPDIETGHEHRNRSARIVLDPTTLDAMGAEQRARFVETLAEAAAAGGDPATFGDRLAARLADHGIEQPRPVVDRLAENLRDAEHVVIVTDDGDVLHGDEESIAGEREPDVRGTEDPEHPDRPLLT